jgi:hypothetical protein
VKIRSWEPRLTEEIGEVTFEGEVTCDAMPVEFTELEDWALLASACLRTKISSSGDGGHRGGDVALTRSCLSSASFSNLLRRSRVSLARRNDSGVLAP